eukprot:scaffold155737_cov27-Tisochrysis_lutea.AAC.1
METPSHTHTATAANERWFERHGRGRRGTATACITSEVIKYAAARRERAPSRFKLLQHQGCGQPGRLPFSPSPSPTFLYLSLDLPPSLRRALFPLLPLLPLPFQASRVPLSRPKIVLVGRGGERLVTAASAFVFRSLCRRRLPREEERGSPRARERERERGERGE